ncbi:MAG TPA: YXWGXW repeat-containing protein [Thermodesulfobacteriota bacterium]|nr:YXWGXW repeat-containing protein [Thermodesulfobacteriota bacterium]
MRQTMLLFAFMVAAAFIFFIAGCFYTEPEREQVVTTTIPEPDNPPPSSYDEPPPVPPAHRSLDPGVPPSYDYVWIPGHWERSGDQWVWVDGQWVLPPHDDSVYVTGH